MLKNKLVFFYALIVVLAISILIYSLNKMDNIVEIYEQEKDIELEIEELKEYITNLPTKTIKVKIISTGEVKDMDINEYLIGVVPSEMPPSHEIEALRAQAIVARTYAYEKMGTNGHADCDICDNSSHCQAYYNIEQIIQAWKNKGYNDTLRAEYLEKVKQAVYSTENVVAIYDNKLIKAYFHADSGGKTEDVSSIWGKQNIPYLVSVESLGEEDHKYYKTTVKLSISDLENKLTQNTSKPCNVGSLTDEIVKIISYTKSGRVDQVDIAGNIYTANELRSALGLKSTNFTVEYNEGNITFNVVGYGHGVGMSQTGANYYAKERNDS